MIFSILNDFKKNFKLKYNQFEKKSGTQLCKKNFSSLFW